MRQTQQRNIFKLRIELACIIVARAIHHDDLHPIAILRSFERRNRAAQRIGLIARD